MNERKQKRQKQESFLFVLMGLILLGLMVSGYFIFVEKILPGISSSQPSRGQTVSGTPDKDNPAGTTADPANEQAGAEAPADWQSISLYFGMKGKDQLVREVRKVPPEKNFLTLANIMVKGLISGPTLISEARQVVPAATQLRSLFFHQGTFIVDFSREFVENHPGGALEEMLTVYSVVNTLTELDKKAKVRILVNGMEVETIKGHVGLKQLFSRNEGINQ